MTKLLIPLKNTREVLMTGFRQHLAQRPLLFTLLFAFGCSFVLIGLATRGSFDLFQPAFLWKAYNHYFLSILDGRLDVPIIAIGKEGSIIDSKAYMYYGLLPVLPRVFLYPFVNLAQVPAAYFSILFFTLLGNVVLQYTLVKHYIANQCRGSFTLLLLISLIVWFGSAAFIISQNATFYHEPYAASLCLASIFIALMLRQNFFLGEYRKTSLVPFAVLAGLCVHARMPSALALYIVTGLLILVQAYRALSYTGANKGLVNVLFQSILIFWKEIVILGLFGVSILWLNYARYGDMLNFMGINNGFTFFEGLSERVCNVLPLSELHKLYRVFVNGYVYLSGDWQSHWSLVRLLSTGYGRLEGPFLPLALLWTLPIASLVVVLWTQFKAVKKSVSQLTLLFLLAFSAGAIFQLMYATIAHRYVASLWLPVFASLLFCWNAYMTQTTSINLKQLDRNKYLVGVVILGLGSIGYQLYQAVTNPYYLEDGPVTSAMTGSANYHYSDEDNAYMTSLTPDKIKSFYIERSKNRAAECKKYNLD
jgi:hypothetical protein